MKDIMRYPLNCSQREIAASEKAGGGSAINTISIKMKLNFSAKEVKHAADAVILSSDIFCAKICGDTDELYFTIDSEPQLSRIIPAMTAENAEGYAENSDRTPLPYPRTLYRIDIIPLFEGGCMLYAVFHHIIIDGYGMSLFAQRISEALRGNAIGKSVFFAEDSNASETDRDNFFCGYLKGAEFEPCVFEAAKGESGYGFARHHADFPKSEIDGFAKNNSLTPAYVLAAVQAVYLYISTGKNDVVFLMPRLSRSESELDTIGCYTLLVPVRVTIAENDRFSDVCRKLSISARAASKHKNIGYSAILHQLRQEGIVTNSLSEYVFNFYRMPVVNTGFSVAGGMRNHVTWSVFCDNDSYQFSFDTSDSVFTKERAGYYIDSIRSILSQGLKDPIVNEIDILGESEKAAVSTFCGKECTIPKNASIASLLSGAVRLYGNKPAVYAGEVSYTFDELDIISSRIAYALMGNGVKKGSCVGLMLSRDYRLLPALFGIVKAGGVFIPIDPAYPDERVSYILEDSGAEFIIAAPDTKFSGGKNILDIDSLMNSSALSRPLPEICRDDLAYIIYTSGTTGRPKGVMLSHRGIVNIVHPDNNPFSRDIVKNAHGLVAVGSISFDIFLFEIFVPLFNGLFIELGNEKSMTDAAELARLIGRHNADALHCTPSRIAAYLKNSDFRAALKNVRAVLSAGEALSSELAEELKNVCKVNIYNGYGPTETTIGATITESGDTSTVGRAINGMGVVVLNSRQQAVPTGAAGEICIYGEGVGLGYKNRPEETSLKFIKYNGRKTYRSGDLGRIGADGRITYLGRLDRQIKLRGLRIELSEIENCACSYQGISNFVCVVRKIGGSEHLAGFYSVNIGAEVSAEALTEYMKSRLTPYMIPEILKELDTLPQTQSGKVDTKALEQYPVEFVRSFRRPQCSRERLVCDAFAEVLDTGIEVGLDDHFFETGGDSLAAAELLLKIEQKLKLKPDTLAFGDLYKYPTPALILKRLDESVEADNGYDIAYLDYSRINVILSAESPAGTRKLGNVLLTGGTGFLGIHILIELLSRPEVCDTVYCLVRPKGKLTAEKRIITNLFYYDCTDASQLLGEKLVVLSGDITSPEIFADNPDIHIDTIINCAADVSHFAYDNSLSSTNTVGVENLIGLAKKQGASVCQISTISVGGIMSENCTKDKFTESDLYIGQSIFNEYIYTKFMAEYHLLNAAAESRINVSIMRVGNLQGRISDGEFQMNRKYNAFTRQLSSYVKMQAVPQSVYDSRVNFSPVDEVARSVTALLSADRRAGIYHICPPDDIAFSRLIGHIQDFGYKINVLPDDEFERLLSEMKLSEEGRQKIDGLLTERQTGAAYVPLSYDYTLSELNRFGFVWSEITDEYLRLYIDALIGMNTFDE